MVMVLAGIAIANLPGIPLGIGVGGTVLALAGAIWFTRWYPRRVRRSSSFPARQAT